MCFQSAVVTVEDRTKLFVGCVMDNAGWPSGPLKAFTNLACQCLVYDPRDRPNMGKILKNMSIMCEEWRGEHPEIDMMLRCQARVPPRTHLLVTFISESLSCFFLSPATLSLKRILGPSGQMQRNGVKISAKTWRGCSISGRGTASWPRWRQGISRI